MRKERENEKCIQRKYLNVNVQQSITVHMHLCDHRVHTNIQNEEKKNINWMLMYVHICTRAASLAKAKFHQLTYEKAERHIKNMSSLFARDECGDRAPNLLVCCFFFSVKRSRKEEKVVM